MNYQPCDHGRSKNDAPNHYATLPTDEGQSIFLKAFSLFCFPYVILRLLAVFTIQILKISSLPNLKLSEKPRNKLKFTKAIQKAKLCRVSNALFGLFYGERRMKKKTIRFVIHVF